MVIVVVLSYSYLNHLLEDNTNVPNIFDLDIWILFVFNFLKHHSSFTVTIIQWFSNYCLQTVIGKVIG